MSKINLLLVAALLGCSSEPGETMTMHEYCRARVNQILGDQMSHVNKQERFKEYRAMINAELFMSCITGKGF